MVCHWLSFMQFPDLNISFSEIYLKIRWCPGEWSSFSGKHVGCEFLAPFRRVDIADVNWSSFSRPFPRLLEGVCRGKSNVGRWELCWWKTVVDEAPNCHWCCRNQRGSKLQQIQVNNGKYSDVWRVAGIWNRVKYDLTSPHFPRSPKLVVLVLGSWTFKHRLRFLAVELAGLYGTRLDANKAGTGSLLVS